MPRRRDFLQYLSSLPFLGGLVPVNRALGAPARRNYLRELGVRPIINGAGVYTMFTGSLMIPEAVDAIQQTSRYFVRLEELHDAIGARIASLVGSEAALVSSGAFGCLTLGTAACISGTDPDLIRRIPETTGMKNEVILQKSHRFAYDHAVRNCGVRLIEVETRDQLETAIHQRTAMMLFLNKADPDGQIKHEEFVALGKKHDIPTMNDCAADVPPVANLTKYVKMGYDLVAFSGGKGIRGPQSSGFLFGRADLIQAARLNTLPHSDTMGRGLKVNKEEMVAAMVALENYLRRDHKAEWREWEKRVKLMGDRLSSLPGVTTERFVPEIANEVPHLRVRWDQGVIKIQPDEVKRRLREGDPSIELIPGGYVKGTLEIASWMLQPGEAEIVARRIGEILRSA